MPSGKTHRLINQLSLLPTMYLLGSQRIDIVIAMLFGLAYIFCMYIATPDRDLQIRLMKHRGISHSIIAWCVLFIVGYHYIGFPALGCIIPIFSHIIVDNGVTKVKRSLRS